MKPPGLDSPFFVHYPTFVILTEDVFPQKLPGSSNGYARKQEQ